MPIYAYKCESCGFAKDILQKMSEAPLVDCPNCEKSSFKKQLTAAGFQLKGSGWYATDFKGGGSASPVAAAPADAGSAPSESASPAPKVDVTPPASVAKAD
jgi:putative FmdB family regulatory protein